MTRFDQFLKERRYLGNLSERSIEWYGQASNGPILWPTK
jgi:hypothetical protein